MIKKVSIKDFKDKKVLNNVICVSIYKLTKQTKRTEMFLLNLTGLEHLVLLHTPA